MATVDLARVWYYRAKRYGIYSQLLVLTAIVVAIHWNLLFEAGGYISWGNFLLPYTNSQYAAYASLQASWSPFQYMGSPLIAPLSQAENFFTALGPLVVLSSFLGPATAAKVYVLTSTLFLGAASLLFLRSVVRGYLGQLTGAMLLIAGPFQLQLFGQGDYVQFVSEAFVLLSVFLLWRALQNPKTRWLWFPLSLLALVLSMDSLQLFALGTVLYMAFFLFYAIPSLHGSFRSRLSSICGLLFQILLLPLLLAPLVLSLLAAPVYLGPSSSYALPLSTFASYSAGPVAVFLTMGYVAGLTPPTFLGYHMVALTAGSLVASIWMGFIVTLVIAVWAGVLFLKDKRGYFLLIVAAGASLLGAGPFGPLGAVNTYLYLHLVGYQELNASYYWDWMLVVPALAASLGILVERLPEFSQNNIPRLAQPGLKSVWAPKGNLHLGNKLLTSRGLRAMGFYLVAVILTTIVIVSSAVPFVVGAQNGSLGIHSVPYPSDYAQIDTILSRLVGSSYAGVALFNPDVNWFLKNGTEMVPNAFFLFPTVRTAGVPVYGAPPFASNYYDYWVYKEFYSNVTRYVGELFAVAGVEYFLVFYGTQSASFYPDFLQFSYGINASHLLEYQSGVIPVVTSKDFAIYRDLYYSGVATSLSNLSVVAGGYSELDAMAYAGVNLTNQGLIFPSDIPAGGCVQYVNRVDRVFAETVNSLYGLALACTSTFSSNPVTAITPDSQSWQSSYRRLGGSVWDAWPTSLATVQGGPYSIEVPIDTGGCTSSCRLWLPIRFSGDGGLLNFNWKGSNWTVNTSRGWQENNNSMVWVQLPFGSLEGTGRLRVTSITGWNSIGTIYVAPSSNLSSWLNSLITSKQVILTAPGNTLQAPLATAVSQSAGYCMLATVDALQRESLCLSADGNSPISLNLSLPKRTSGELSILVRTIGTAVLILDPGLNQSDFGFDTRDYNSTNFSMSWIRVPISPMEITADAELPLQVANGTAFISEVIFTPSSAYAPPTHFLPGPNLTIRSVYYTSEVSSLNLTVKKVSPIESLITGEITFHSSTSYLAGLANAVFGLTPPLNTDILVRYTVAPSLLMGMDGAKLGGNISNGLVQYSSTLLSLPPGLNLSSLYLDFKSYGGKPNATVTASFRIWIELADMQLQMNVTNAISGSSWTIAAGSNGYSLAGGPGDLVLTRVPFFADLSVQGNGLTLASALGSIDSLIWNPHNATTIGVTPASAVLSSSGYAIMGLSLGAWIVVGYIWRRRQKRAAKHAPSANDSAPENL